MVTKSSRLPTITKEAKELLEATRVASLSGREPIEPVILGICRGNRDGSIKKGKHISRIVSQNLNLFYRKPCATLQGRKCHLILPTPEGNEVLDMLETSNGIIHPVSLVRRQRHVGSPTLYILDAYYTDTSGCKRPLTLLFQGKLLFLEHGDVETIPDDATEVVGEIKCLWKQCVNEVLNFQDPQSVASLPHIKHLLRYLVSRFRIDTMSMSSESDLEYACLLEMKKLFPGTKEMRIKSGYDEVSILRVPLTKYEEVYICKKCKTTSCHHLEHVLNHSRKSDNLDGQKEL
jgi:hypothetical protein